MSPLLLPAELPPRTGCTLHQVRGDRRCGSAARSAAGWGLGREDLRQRAGAAWVPFQLLGVAERHFLEPHPVLPGGPGDVQVTVDDGEGAEAQVPVRRLLGAAPLGEL